MIRLFFFYLLGFVIVYILHNKLTVKKIFFFTKYDLKSSKLFYYCSCNQDKNFSNDTDSTTIGIELCKIPQISEHCP